jgi:uncharacterized protein (TIGR01244 family)
LQPGHLAAVAQAGFRSVINNRPDGEGGPAQPSDDAIREAAQRAGVVHAYLPVDGANVQHNDIEAFARLLARLPKPVLAFCRSGARSRKLYLAAQALAVRV